VAGREAGGAVRGVELVKEGGEFLEHGVHVVLDGPQGMMAGTVAWRWRTVRN